MRLLASGWDDFVSCFLIFCAGSHDDTHTHIEHVVHEVSVKKLEATPQTRLCNPHTERYPCSTPQVVHAFRILTGSRIMFLYSGKDTSVEMNIIRRKISPSLIKSYESPKKFFSKIRDNQHYRLASSF